MSLFQNIFKRILTAYYTWRLEETQEDIGYLEKKYGFHREHYYKELKSRKKYLCDCRNELEEERKGLIELRETESRLLSKLHLA